MTIRHGSGRNRISEKKENPIKEIKSIFKTKPKPKITCNEKLTPKWLYWRILQNM